MVEKNIAFTVWLVSSVRSISFLGVVCWIRVEVLSYLLIQIPLPSMVNSFYNSFVCKYTSLWSFTFAFQQIECKWFRWCVFSACCNSWLLCVNIKVMIISYMLQCFKVLLQICLPFKNITGSCMSPTTCGMLCPFLLDFVTVSANCNNTTDYIKQTWRCTYILK